MTAHIIEDCDSDVEYRRFIPRNRRDTIREIALYLQTYLSSGSAFMGRDEQWENNVYTASKLYDVFIGGSYDSVV